MIRSFLRPLLLSLLAAAALTGCAGEAPAPAPEAEVSELRSGFRAVTIAACERRFRDQGMSRQGVDALCPCLADELLAAAPDDAALMDLPAREMDVALRTCLDRLGARGLLGAETAR
ncbi:hypothetical protein [Brevundimonas sp.]|uniref:hypothetical protein n=1 Tax=Brevundimonas sp. TaxID=1871086 RepID=UPI002613FFBE|nr:hypothetical protein [Brevundimonas sp.]